MKTVITYGTFDLLHPGHVNLLRRAKELGDRLIVAISTDEFNAIKGKRSSLSFEERKLVVEAVRYVDMVIPEESWEQKTTDVKRHAVDVFTIGDDWAGKFDFLANDCEVVYLPRTPDISSTKLKNQLRGEPPRLVAFG